MEAEVGCKVRKKEEVGLFSCGKDAGCFRDEWDENGREGRSEFWDVQRIEVGDGVERKGETMGGSGDEWSFMEVCEGG